jgi:hypothetical protein
MGVLAFAGFFSMRATTLTLWAMLAVAACDKHSQNNSRATGSAETSEQAASPRRPYDAGVAEARTLARHIVTYYRHTSTEVGNATTNGDSIEHGVQHLHFVIEVARDAQQKITLNVGGLSGDTNVPQQVRMRQEGPRGGTFSVERNAFNKFTIENFGGSLRAGEPVRALLASAPGAREIIALGATPTFVRMPATGEITGGSARAIGQVDAVVVFIVPVIARRGGRYLIHAIDMNAEPGGFAANGIMTHIPSDAEITRYVQWMRDRNGMGRDRNPPIALRPIDLS